MRVELLNDKAWTPTNVVAKLPVDEIKRIVVIYEHEDGTNQVVSSHMSTRDFVWFAAVMERRARNLLESCCEF